MATLPDIPEQGLVDFSRVPFELTLDKTYELHPLTFGDYCAAQNWVKKQHMDMLLGTICGVPMDDRVRAITIAEVAQSQVSLAEVMSTKEGELYLLYLSLKRGDAQCSFEQLRDSLPPLSILIMTRIVNHITGFSDPVTEGADPLAGTTITAKSSKAETTGKTTSVQSASNVG